MGEFYSYNEVPIAGFIFKVYGPVGFEELGISHNVFSLALQVGFPIRFPAKLYEGTGWMPFGKGDGTA